MARTAPNTVRRNKTLHHHHTAGVGSPTTHRNNLNRFIHHQHSHFIRVLVPRTRSRSKKRSTQKIRNIQDQNHADNHLEEPKNSSKDHSLKPPSDDPVDSLDETHFNQLRLDLSEIQVDDQIFRKFDTVFIISEEAKRPKDDEKDHYWIAIIKEIKRPTREACQKSPNTWLKVEWFYRFDDCVQLKSSHALFNWVSNKLRRFGFRSNDEKLKSNDCRFQDKELIRTDHSSIIRADSLAGKAEVYKFNDQLHPDLSISQPACFLGKELDNHPKNIDHEGQKPNSIGLETFYYRIELSLNLDLPLEHRPPSRKFQSKSKLTRRLLNSIQLLKSEYGCGCSQIYDPNEDMMIFNLKKQAWIHMKCLIPKTSQKEEAIGDHESKHLIPDRPAHLHLDDRRGMSLPEIKQNLLKFVFTTDLAPPTSCASSNYLPPPALDEYFFGPFHSCFLRGLHSSLAGKLV